MTLNEFIEKVKSGEVNAKLAKRVAITALLETANLLKDMDDEQFTQFDGDTSLAEFLVDLANLEDDDFFGTEGLRI